MATSEDYLEVFCLQKTFLEIICNKKTLGSSPAVRRLFKEIPSSEDFLRPFSPQKTLWWSPVFGRSEKWNSWGYWRHRAYLRYCPVSVVVVISRYKASEKQYNFLDIFWIKRSFLEIICPQITLSNSPAVGRLFKKTSVLRNRFGAFLSPRRLFDSLLYSRRPFGIPSVFRRPSNNFF